LYTKESWWEVEDELKETKATNLNLRSLYGGIHDAEFLFLRVIGIRRLASRGDVVQRLRESMSSTGPLSNWTEGIDISDLEELENIQTSSYFRPADWRAPGEEDDAANDSGQEAATERASASFRPPQTTGSAHPPAWRSPEAARDAEDRANAALRADAARREAAETAARAKAKAKAAATTAESRGGQAQPSQSELAERPRQRFSWQRYREARTEASQGAPVRAPEAAGHSAGAGVPPAESESPRHSEPGPGAKPVPPAPPSPMTWSRLRAQQAEADEQSQRRQSEPTFEDGRAAAPKMRGTRASAWASFRSAESLQAQENQDLPHRSDHADSHEDADALQLRLAALRAAAQCRKTEVEDLRRERQTPCCC